MIEGILWVAGSTLAGVVYLVYTYFEQGGKNRDKA